MSNKINQKIKSIVSLILTVCVISGIMPTISYAAQSNEYVDPADRWVEANGRTNELDINATTTYETQYCPVCDMETTVLTYRVPEYTKSGNTALNRDVMYSDGTCIDGVSTGNLDDGTPGTDAYFSGYHWTKSVCQNCGTINSVDGLATYSCGKNVYGLNPCDSNFFQDFDNTTYIPYNSKYHITTLKAGQYCQFCKGTFARATEKQESHDFTEQVDPQLGNQRFHIEGECDKCGFVQNEYVIAKSVVQSYYGKADGKTHTITVSDLSEDGVRTSIRYGTEADSCNLTSAPNYTDEGYYPVYYKITYSYSGESMTENGVSYVWLLKDNDSSVDLSGTTTPHVHDYRFLETIRQTCTELGYDRFQCNTCGSLQKTNYTPATGHNYDTVTVREASCTQGGFVLHMCKSCGDYYTENTSMTDHKYETHSISSTCTMNGYTEHICIDCGYKYITDLTPLAKHDYREKVTSPTCISKGFTAYTCANCDDVYTSDYVDPTGHEWDNGTEITSSTCESEGVIEYHCKHCSEKMIQAVSAKGHTPGKAATCTEAQACESCGAVLELPKGHHYSEIVTPSTCTSMGYTTYICDECGTSYTGDYTDKAEHHYTAEITLPTCTDLGFTTYTCTECGDEYKSDYTDKKPHNYKAVITPATCTAMGYTTYTCDDCSDSYIADYTEALPHNYTKKVIEPTCTSQGYTIYTCPDCGKEYISDEKEATEHYFTSIVTAPKCEEMGYTTYTCGDCGYSYVADYTNPTGHNYNEVVTLPTCTEIGFSNFKCSHCGDTYKGNETAKAPHNYEKVITEPTCTEMGYTVFTCKDCSDSYTGDYTDAKGHSFKETVTAPTCTEIGYSTFTCEICGKSYRGNEIAKTEHNYEKTVTDPTCTELGYTTYVCADCGDEIKSDYIEAAGHKPGGWIIDIPATIENSGSKHVECTVCGETLETAEIPRLNDNDNSDEDGYSKVGDYSILVTDKNNKPIFNSEIRIDKNDNITIKLPDGRLLSAEDKTTITVTYTDTQQPAQDINIFVADSSNNAATGKTDVNGQLSVPNKQSSTGDTNGTVTDGTNTYVVVVTDKNGVIIPDCDVLVGENYSINVTLPEGTAFDRDNRITVTVITEKGDPVKGLRIQLIGEGDYVENGYTNIKGQVTLPMSNTDITDDNGNGEVGDTDGDKLYDYIVTVSDEKGFIKNALVTLIAKDNSILVCLPEDKVIDYFNRITVKVIRADGTPVEGLKVSVYNKDGSSIRTEITDENGIVIVPPLSEAPIAKPTPTPEPDAEATPLPGVDATPKPGATDKPSESEKPSTTDKPRETTNPTDKPGEPTSTPNIGEGAIVQNKDYKYRVFVWDNDGAITEFGLVKLLDNGNLIIELPKNKTLTSDNKVNIKVINEDDKTPVKGIVVTVNDSTGTTATDITNSNGIAVVPMSGSDTTDGNGNAAVKDDKGNLYYINIATEIKGNIEGAAVQIADGKITVTLPDGIIIDYTDRTIVTVTDKDKKPVSAIPINVKDNKGGDRTENTDVNGKVIVPPLDEDYTDKDGNAKINDYIVIVEDTKTKIENAFVRIEDGKISIKLPDANVLETSNQTTVTVLDKDSKPVQGISVTVTDKNSKTATKATDSSGKITVPVKSSGGGGGGSSSGGGGGSYSTVSMNVKVVDKDGKSVSVTKSIRDDKVTLTLPNGTFLDGSNYYTITVTDSKGNAKADIEVTLKDKKDGEASGTTDKNGQLILPAKEHRAYIVGYENGEFRPEGNMTRAEAAAIFARNIAERKSEDISNSKSAFTDVSAKEWYNSYISYLEKYDIIKGYSDGTFKPDEQITRAEFVTMCTRFYTMFGDVKTSNKNSFTDTKNNHWAYGFINNAVAMEWIKGYADGTFRPDENITRAEVVTIVNRVTDRSADMEYINKNMSAVNKFTDLKDKAYWAFYEIIEASNTHMAVICADGEDWVK